MVENGLIPIEIAPQAIVTRAQKTADACRQIVMKCSIQLHGRGYIQAEGWQALAAATGYSPRIERVEELENGDIRAVCSLVRLSDGEIVAQAEGFVGMDEPAWNKRPRYARRAMAQTRATSRACRSALAWIVPMLGENLSTTPAEEMPHDDPQLVDPVRVQANKITDAQLKKINAMVASLKNMGAISDAESFRQEMREKFGVTSSKDLTIEQASEVIDQLQERESISKGEVQ